MIERRSAREWARLLRYYQAGLVNMGFGFGLYALFVWSGMNIYVAQVCAHVLGVAFNYLTYSRYAFAGDQGSKGRFILSYAGNYLLGLAMLTVVARVVPSPYLAGLLTTITVSVVNYVVLKRLVFVTRKA